MLDKVSSISTGSTFGRAVALGLAYWFTVALAVELINPVDKIALFWPPNAIAAAALIFSSRKHWPVYIIAMSLAFFAGSVPTGQFPLYVYFGFCIANIIEVLIVAAMVKRFIRTPITNEALTKVLPVIMLASIPATFVSALIGGSFIISAIEGTSFFGASVSWFTSDLSGLLIILPVLLVWMAPGAPTLKSYNKNGITERVCIAATFIAIGIWVPIFITEASQVSLVIPYLVFPVLIWTAIRLRIRSTATAALAVSMFIIALKYLGYGSFNIEGLSAFGQVVLMMVSLITITITTIFLAVVVEERRRVEEVLMESKERFRSVIDNTPSYITLKDKEGRFQLVNRTYLDMTGHEFQDILGRCSVDFLSGKVAEEALAHDRKVMETKSPVTMERGNPTKQGIRDFLITKFPVLDESGEIKGIGSIGTDITDHKRAEQTQERLTQAVETVPVGIVLFDSNDRLVFFNSRYKELMEVIDDIIKPGVSFEELIRTMVKRQPPKNAQGREEEFIQERIKHHRNPTGPFEVRRESTWMVSNETRLPDGSIFNIISDITEQKQAEEDRRLALIDAEQANQAKSEFLATMSHELRTPLNAILGFSDILSHQYFGPPGAGKYREYANDIHASGEHLLELVNDLLDISTIEAGKQSLAKEELFTDEIVRECVNIITEKARSNGTELVIKVSENIPPLYADRRAIKQILLNLLSNSVKFTAKGGKIIMSAKASNGNTTLKIADTGKGIPGEKLPELTNPFTKGELDPHIAVDGWGLGLSITKSLVDLHDGTLEIQSKVGKGTTVTVTIPNGSL